MWKSILYKEWLKIRWFAIIYAALGVLVVGNIFLKVQHDFEFSKAANYWYSILFHGNRFYEYSLFKFVPLGGALAIALAQYFPETVNKRIKLTFHLPVNENKALLVMMLFGTFCLFAIAAIQVLFFTGLSLLYFPAEIIQSALISVAPWFLCGFAVYFLSALIVLEPVWKYRFFIPFGSCQLCSYLPSISRFKSLFSCPTTVNLAYSSFISCFVVFGIPVQKRRNVTW